ncbi:hypothetical protein [Brevibacterium oceani]|uniref:hypothetical protein n=1 Tax=Brevibacterium oceani TaxID=358099 RepID=UPI0015E6DF6F|nr:hypothetical protein [Brevibacterium oceani]
MKSVRLGAVMVAGAIILAGCGGGAESNEAQPIQEETVEPIADYTGPPVKSQNNWPCFTVGEVGSGLSMTWELVVAARDAPDQPEYIDDLVDEGDDLWEDIEDDTTCSGGTELADFNYEVANLNIDVTLDQDTDEQYEKIADLGNALLDLSDEENHEWSYEFVTDVSEIDP